MLKEIVTAMNEAVFYFTFGSHQKYMKALLEEVLEKQITEIIPMNSKLMKDNLMSKCKYLDYVIKTNHGICNIEINNLTNIGIINRNVIYGCQLVANSSKKGKSYKNVTNTIQINFCRLGSNVELYQEYTLRAKNNVKGYPEELTDMLKIIIVNVDKCIEKYYNEDEEFVKRKPMMCAMTLPLKEVKKLAKESGLLMGYEKDLEKVLDDEDFAKWISPEEEEEKMKQTYIDMGLEQGIEKGKEKGFVQGKENEKLEIAKKMLSEKCEIEFISKMTGLSIKEIEKL